MCSVGLLLWKNFSLYFRINLDSQLTVSEFILLFTEKKVLFFPFIEVLFRICEDVFKFTFSTVENKLNWNEQMPRGFWSGSCQLGMKKWGDRGGGIISNMIKDIHFFTPLSTIWASPSLSHVFRMKLHTSLVDILMLNSGKTNGNDLKQQMRWKSRKNI